MLHIAIACFSHYSISRFEFELSTNCRQFNSIIQFKSDFHPKTIVAVLAAI